MTTPRKKDKSSEPKKGNAPTELVKQQIADIEHKLSIDIGSLLVLMAEGTQEQVVLANQKTKRDLIKFGPDMQKLATQAGGQLPKVVDEYLDSIDGIVHSASGWVDEAKVAHCYNLTQKLHKELGMD